MPSFAGHVTDFLSCREAEGFEVSSQQPSILSVTNHPETKRQSPDHRTFVIVGAKVANKSLFWSHMALFWSDLFLGSLWLHFMGYRTFERDTSDLGFVYCVWINF